MADPVSFRPIKIRHRGEATGREDARRGRRPNRGCESGGGEMDSNECFSSIPLRGGRFLGWGRRPRRVSVPPRDLLIRNLDLCGRQLRKNVFFGDDGRATRRTVAHGWGF